MLAFLSFAAVLAWTGWSVSKRAVNVPDLDAAQELTRQMIQPEQQALEWQDLPPVDTVAIELGYRLVPLAETDKGAELLARVRGIRKTLSEQYGFLLPRSGCATICSCSRISTGSSCPVSRWRWGMWIASA